jgi:hypothetical protein
MYQKRKNQENSNNSNLNKNTLNPHSINKNKNSSSRVKPTEKLKTSHKSLRKSSVAISSRHHTS